MAIAQPPGHGRARGPVSSTLVIQVQAAGSEGAVLA